MARKKNSHTGVNTGTIINTRYGKQGDAYKVEHYRFCDTCKNYDAGKCNAGDIKGIEIEDKFIANKCRFYSGIHIEYSKPYRRNKKKK